VDDASLNSVRTDRSGVTVEVNDPGLDGVVTVAVEDGVLGDDGLSVRQLRLDGVRADSTVGVAAGWNGLVSPPGNETLLAVEPTVRGTPPGSVTYRLAVDGESLAGADPDSLVVVARTDTGWHRLDPAVGAGTMTVTTDGTAPLVVSTPARNDSAPAGTGPNASKPAPQSAAIGPPNVTVRNDTVVPGESVTVTASFSNDGTRAGTVEATFTAFDEAIDQRAVRVPAGDIQTVQFSYRLGEPGEYRLGVNNRTTTVSAVDEPAAETVGAEDDGLLPIPGTLGTVFALLVVLGSAAVFLSRRL
jgi:hypothetical protein